MADRSNSGAEGAEGTLGLVPSCMGFPHLAARRSFRCPRPQRTRFVVGERLLVQFVDLPQPAFADLLFRRVTAKPTVGGDALLAEGERRDQPRFKAETFHLTR